MSGSQVAGAPGSAPANLPVRSFSTSSALTDRTDEGEAVPLENPSDTSELLGERLRAWKHAVGYLEDYIGATEKVQRQQSKEYEKVLKTIANPLKEGHHFQQELGGMAACSKTCERTLRYASCDGLINSHLETEKNLKGTVLPILDRLHKEIKNKSKELLSGASKGAKEVDKARNITQKHIELLGSQTANYQSSAASMKSAEDPYVVHRGILHRLHKQVLEENTNRHDLIQVQNNFAQFEAHVIEIIQQTMMSFTQIITSQSQKEQTFFSDILNTCQGVPANLEWEGFVNRNQALLVDPNAPDRSVEAISFPNQNHASTQALIEGSLERKSRNKLSFAGYTTGYYVVTPSKFLHEFKDNDNIRKDPVPELSIYLPDAIIGSTSGEKFNIKGKDVSKGIGSKLSGTSEIAFKAHSAADANKWYEVIRSVAGSGPAEATSPMGPLSPTSPADSKQSSMSYPAEKQPESIQTGGTITGGETVASPVTTNTTDFAPGTVPEKTG
ncbi:PH domain-containing protein [Botrytis cinerea]